MRRRKRTEEEERGEGAQGAEQELRGKMSFGMITTADVGGAYWNSVHDAKTTICFRRR